MFIMSIEISHSIFNSLKSIGIWVTVVFWLWDSDKLTLPIPQFSLSIKIYSTVFVAEFYSTGRSFRKPDVPCAMREAFTVKSYDASCPRNTIYGHRGKRQCESKNLKTIFENTCSPRGFVRKGVTQNIHRA